MSVMNQSGEEQAECPLCMEPLEVDDLHFYPCTCGYQICRFCWNRIREGENGLCPACRKAYPENPADFTPLSQEQVAAIKTEKKAREQRRRNKTLESRRALANVRVVQNNLVFVVGLPVRLADPEVLKRPEYFGKYGKIHKVVINQSTAYAGSQGPSASAYVTYVSSADALRAIQGVNNVTLDGRVLKTSLGTTKYCANFMKNQPCPKTDCMYLHELGDPKASFTKEEMHQGLHQIYERRLHNQLLAQTQQQEGNSSNNGEKSPKEGSQSNFIPTTVVTSSNINIVNSSNTKWKKDENGGMGGAGAGAGSGAGGSAGVAGDAWPSLGSSPASSPDHRPDTDIEPGTSQEIGSSESSSPVQSSSTKCRDNHKSDKSSKKDHQHNGRTKTKDDRSKQSDSTETLPETDSKQESYEIDRDVYLSNELDELESDRHSLLENHDLLDSDLSLLDNSTHDLLDDDAELMRHREMLEGQNGFGLMEGQNIGLLEGQSLGLLEGQKGFGLLEGQNGFGLMEGQKELLMRERSRAEMLARQNELLARQHNLPEHKHFLAGSSSVLHAANDLLLGAGYGHGAQGSLDAFSNGFGLLAAQAQTQPQTQAPAQAPAQHPLLSPHLTNGFAEPALHHAHAQLHSNGQEGRYGGENMEKFFTDFHKTQQMKYLLQKGQTEIMQPQLPAQVQSAAFIESQLARRYGAQTFLEQNHYALAEKQRALENALGKQAAAAAHAGGDGDDDLDFDPFQETQKALAEMMESEMTHTRTPHPEVERVVVARMPPPGFGHMNAFGLGLPRPQQPPHQPHHAPHQPHQAHQGFPSSAALYADWTQMDPAIMSASASAQPAAGKGAPAQLSAHQQDVFARFNSLALHAQGQTQAQAHPSMLAAQMGAGANSTGAGGQRAQFPHSLPWGFPAFSQDKPFAGIPLPPGFAPNAKPPHLPPECIDAK